eukprot:1150826-Pelagomonas_calceolata.AAC.5
MCGPFLQLTNAYQRGLQLILLEAYMIRRCGSTLAQKVQSTQEIRYAASFEPDTLLSVIKQPQDPLLSRLHQAR